MAFRTPVSVVAPRRRCPASGLTGSGVSLAAGGSDGMRADRAHGETGEQPLSCCPAVIRSNTDKSTTASDELFPLDNRLPGAGRAGFKVDRGRVKLASRLRGGQKRCVERVQKDPSNSGRLPADGPSRQSASVAEITCNLSERGPSKELPKDLPDVLCFGLINSVPRARGISFNARHPAVPMRRLTRRRVSCQTPPHGVSGGSLCLDPDFSLGEEHELLEHEVV